MVYFLFSFLIGGLFALIPVSREFLNLLVSALHDRTLEIWQLFLLSGFAFSVLFSISKYAIQKHGYIAFWLAIAVATLLIVLLVIFSASFPKALHLAY